MINSDAFSSEWIIYKQIPEVEVATCKNLYDTDVEAGRFVATRYAVQLFDEQRRKEIVGQSV